MVPILEGIANIFYRPQRSCGKVMFLHLCVILFTGGVSACGPEGCLPQPPGRPLQQTPLADTPWVDTPWQTPPLWADTPGQTPPAQCVLGYDGQQAGGTHPTGMHSCSAYFHRKLHDLLKYQKKKKKRKERTQAEKLGREEGVSNICLCRSATELIMLIPHVDDVIRGNLSHSTFSPFRVFVEFIELDKELFSVCTQLIYLCNCLHR